MDGSTKTFINSVRTMGEEGSNLFSKVNKRTKGGGNLFNLITSASKITPNRTTFKAITYVPVKFPGCLYIS